MLLSVEEIGASQDTGGNNTGAFEVGVDGQGNIKNENLKKGGIGKIKVTNRGGGYPDGTYSDVDLGNGAVGTVVIQNNQLNDVVITDGGNGFGLGDGIQINLPPGSGAEVQVDGVKAPSPPKPSQNIGQDINLNQATDGGTGQASGGGFDTGANLAGGGIGGTIGIGSGDNITQGVGEGGPTPPEIGVGIGAGVTTGVVNNIDIGNRGS